MIVLRAVNNQRESKLLYTRFEKMPVGSQIAGCRLAQALHYQSKLRRAGRKASRKFEEAASNYTVTLVK
jgi:hypothetical protein